MQIIYEPNPLAAKIILDEREQKELWYKIKIEILEELLYDVYFNLSEKNDEFFDSMNKTKDDRMKDALDSVNPDYYLLENSEKITKIDERTNLLFNYHFEELQSDHCGDCTCVPAACGKCHAEDKVGTYTTKGLGKHSARTIDAAFQKYKTIDEVLNYLKTKDYKPDETSWDRLGGWEQFVPRWKTETESAIDWLTAYKEQHFKGEITMRAINSISL